MQSIPINPAVVQGSTVAGSLGGQANKQAASGDFMATFLQMMGGQQQSTELDGLTGLLGGQSDSEDDPNSLQGAMDLMSMLFMQSGADVNFAPSPMAYQGDTQSVAIQQAALQQQAAIQQMAAMGLYQPSGQTAGNGLTAEQLGALSQNATPAQLLAALQGGQDSTQQPIRTGTATAAPVEDGYLPKELSDMLKSAGGNYTGQSDTVLDPLQSAYSKLYSSLQNPQTTAKDDSKIDIEALQQAVDNGTYLSGDVIKTLKTGLTEQIAPRDILQQVEAGITERLAQSQKPGEFTIKLRPEGLGEITVKLVETAGKIALSITTTTQQAQNALTGELGTLREALRPYNAEISQIVQSDPAAAFAQQQSMSEHNHGSQQDGRNSGQRYWVPEDDTPVEDIRSYAAALSSSLNAYI